MVARSVCLARQCKRSGPGLIRSAGCGYGEDELDAFKPNLTRAEADIRIAMLKAKLKLLDGPPHTL
jgi:hypothetical protein